MQNLWTRGLFLSSPIVDPKPNAAEPYNNLFATKTVVIPKRVEAVWLHNALNVETGRISFKVPYTTAFIMHLRIPLVAGTDVCFLVLGLEWRHFISPKNFIDNH